MIVAAAKQQHFESLDAFAASLEPRMRAAILDGIEALRAGVDMRALEEALARGSPYGVELALGVERLPDLLADVRGVILDAVRGGGDIAAAEIGLPVAQKQHRRVGLGGAGAFRFDITDPDVLDYVRNHSGALITEISETTRAGIRDLIAEEFRVGRTPQQTARIIRQRIGLTQAQEQIAQNYERTLRAAVRGEATWGQVNAYTLNPIRGAGGLVESRVDSAVGTYRQRLLNMRADTIARTETFAAAGAGRQEMWKQMQARGALPPGTEREWSAAFDACQICQDLNGKRATIDGVYPGGFKGPPAHPNCRCSEGLTFKPKPGAAAQPPPAAPSLPTPLIDPLTTAQGFVAEFVEQIEMNAVREYVANPRTHLNMHGPRRNIDRNRVTFAENAVEDRIRASGVRFSSRGTQGAAEEMVDRVNNAVADWAGNSSTVGGAALKHSAARRSGGQVTYHNGYIDHDIALQNALRNEATQFVHYSSLKDEMLLEDFDFAAEKSAEFTREVLRQATGKDTITVWRGTSENALKKSGYAQSPTTGSELEWSMNGAESWTLNRETAEGFASGVRARGGTGVVMEAELPIDRVLHTSATDKNLFLEEAEVIAGGKPINTKIVTVSRPSR